MVSVPLPRQSLMERRRQLFEEKTSPVQNGPPDRGLARSNGWYRKNSDRRQRYADWATHHPQDRRKTEPNTTTTPDAHHHIYAQMKNPSKTSSASHSSSGTYGGTYSASTSGTHSSTAQHRCVRREAPSEQRIVARIKPLNDALHALFVFLDQSLPSGAMHRCEDYQRVIAEELLVVEQYVEEVATTPSVEDNQEPSGPAMRDFEEVARLREDLLRAIRPHFDDDRPKSSPRTPFTALGLLADCAYANADGLHLQSAPESTRSARRNDARHAVTARNRVPMHVPPAPPGTAQEYATHGVTQHASSLPLPCIAPLSPSHTSGRAPGGSARDCRRDKVGEHGIIFTRQYEHSAVGRMVESPTSPHTKSVSKHTYMRLEHSPSLNPPAFAMRAHTTVPTSPTSHPACSTEAAVLATPAHPMHPSHYGRDRPMPASCSDDEYRLRQTLSVPQLGNVGRAVAHLGSTEVSTGHTVGTSAVDEWNGMYSGSPKAASVTSRTDVGAAKYQQSWPQPSPPITRAARWSHPTPRALRDEDGKDHAHPAPSDITAARVSSARDSASSRRPAHVPGNDKTTTTALSSTSECRPSGVLVREEYVCQKHDDARHARPPPAHRNDAPQNALAPAPIRASTLISWSGRSTPSVTSGVSAPLPLRRSTKEERGKEDLPLRRSTTVECGREELSLRRSTTDEHRKEELPLRRSTEVDHGKEEPLRRSTEVDHGKEVPLRRSTKVDQGKEEPLRRSTMVEQGKEEPLRRSTMVEHGKEVLAWNEDAADRCSIDALVDGAWHNEYMERGIPHSHEEKRQDLPFQLSDIVFHIEK
eukprot:GEMP01010283.1.p1 GENE.GEMP01010283.1~~GEMP01010283.1.p1  ORF type:complete len:815 (+),score=206.84 GEMP01010283.1:189-2633(+)